MINFNKMFLDTELEDWEEWSFDSYNFLKDKKEWMQLIKNVKEIMTIIDKWIVLLSSSDFKMNTYKKTIVFSMTIILESALKTLDTVLYCLRTGKESDAFNLMRKFRDDLIFYLYVELKTKPTISSDNITRHYKNIKIEDWIFNTLKDLKWYDCLEEIKQNNDIKGAIKKYKLFNNNNYKDAIFNNYVHANGINFYNQHMWTYDDKRIAKSAQNLNKKITSFFRDFLFSLILLRPISIMATDYEDYLSNGVIPPPIDTQYIVAPFICDYIHSHFKYEEIKYLQEVTKMKLL